MRGGPRRDGGPVPGDGSNGPGEHHRLHRRDRHLEPVGCGKSGTDVVFTITKITTNGRCTEQFAEKSRNGHYLFPEVSVTTSPSMDRGLSPGVLNPVTFSVIGQDGVTETGNSLVTNRTFGCLAHGKRLPAALGPGQADRGTIVPDSRNATGRLVLTPYGLDGFDGCEWDLGTAIRAVAPRTGDSRTPSASPPFLRTGPTFRTPSPTLSTPNPTLANRHPATQRPPNHTSPATRSPRARQRPGAGT
ncbi:hypothetical protein GCM10027445_44290 [Amycolatopsis endophytica]|uniref:Uncharacterized protein n=1 Tax=Amycolatopsis endophytica TaxID=860233 RepID=A0A853BDW4_9PSEU|nr:hypothetical protein [Amycolatopsis endophytica]NYI93210.1 hypothetical protein [Amycolatopsis endophytica]